MAPFYGWGSTASRLQPLKLLQSLKLQKFEYLENEKSFLDEIKNIFHSFKGPFGEKIKI